MSDLSSSSYCRDNKCDNNGFSPMLLILLLLCSGGDGGGIFGGKGSCGGGCGMDGILPLILLLSLGGGCC